MHALIIEDDFLIAMEIEDVLRACGFQTVAFAASKDQALAAADEKLPDLITADVQLRPDCGIDTIEAISLKYPVPVLFITGNSADVGQRLPGHSVLNKPFSEAGLVAAVSDVMEDDQPSPMSVKGQRVPRPPHWRADRPIA